jgi:hypothetical protein
MSRVQFNDVEVLVGSLRKGGQNLLDELGEKWGARRHKEEWAIGTLCVLIRHC